jgi:hypothetical protein
MRQLAILTAALLVAGCSSSGYSGFLKDYSKLRPSTKRPSAVSWEKPGVDMAVYKRLIIDPVQVYLHPGSEASDIGARRLTEVARHFTRILRETIGPHYTVVSKPGPGIMRVRIAITDVAPEAKATADAPLFDVGKASMEGEFLDSESGERLAAVVDHIEGSAAYRDAPREWRHVEGAFIEWSNLILDWLRAKHPAEE